MTDRRSVDLSAVAALYSASLAEHGSSARGVGWKEADDQDLRFDKLAAVIDDRSAPIIVNDLGCGYGALYDFLRSSGIEVEQFNGYDISQDMLGVAADRIGGPGVELIDSSDLDREADYSFASGIFNVRLAVSEDAWVDHVRATLENMAENSTRGLAFNLLSSYVDYRAPDLFYGDPREWFDYCKRNLSPRVSLLHDYPLYEWTILVRF